MELARFVRAWRNRPVDELAVMQLLYNPAALVERIRADEFSESVAHVSKRFPMDIECCFSRSLPETQHASGGGFSFSVSARSMLLASPRCGSRSVLP
jgi:hypothetical protein